GGEGVGGRGGGGWGGRAGAAAQRKGSHARVLPVDTSSTPPSARSEPSTAPIGATPPPSPLPRHTTSGVTPSRSTARKVPHRPQPVLTSSAHSSQPCSAHNSSSAGKNDCGGVTTPPEPSTGSITTPATSSG